MRLSPHRHERHHKKTIVTVCLSPALHTNHNMRGQKSHNSSNRNQHRTYLHNDINAKNAIQHLETVSLQT